VTDEQISEVLKVITHNTCHRFVLLTKRPARMWATFKDTPAPPNLYPGVSIEDSEALAERLYLPPQGQRQVVSFEPLLGPVDLWDATDCIQKSIQWVIVGAEQSRSAARPMRPQWAHSIRCWAHQTNTPYFFKKPSSGTTIAGDTLDREYPW
jgi:protein gp37